MFLFNTSRLQLLFFIALGFLIVLCQSCQQDTSEPNNQKVANKQVGTLFKQRSAKYTNVGFNNRISEDASTNYFSYNYFYNGGGVAVGDIDNDGKPDLYFSGNQVSNKLYKNLGDLKFEDITKKSNVGLRDRWSTGVSMIDINADGWLDIYVCVAGNPADAKLRRNQLYINQKDGTFVESAEALGLADQGYSTQAYFWDYDKDNDLDVYIVNHRVDFKNNSKINSQIARDIRPESSDQLYQNNNGKFTNVTAAAGIANKAWGLSASINDFDGNGWPDIYVTNDFLEPDYLYLNQGNGKFIEASKDVFDHISFYAMGSDVADINNDGLNDLFVLDMVSEDHVRSKRNMAAMSNANFWNMVKYGFHRQYMLNTLQLNNGKGSFSEISSMAGTSKTDWSWAPLIADFDMDGFQDIFVTNGIKRDVTDNDFKINAQKAMGSGEEFTADKALSMMTSTKISNYAFKNNGNLSFKKSQNRWGLHQPLNSNGAMYADLDSDGDLDLVVNNMDVVASIYENTSSNKKSLRVKLEGPATNVNGIGATVIAHGKASTFTRSVYPSRGFMSSGIGELIIPIGDEQINTIEVTWPDGKFQNLEVANNHTISFEYKHAGNSTTKKRKASIFRGERSNLGIPFTHLENQYDDFIDEILLPHRQSRQGPAMASADVNGDDLKDLFFGGAFGQSRQGYIQSGNQFLSATSIPSGEQKEDVDALFFDADGDGDQDLYIVCGGNEGGPRNQAYQDELLLNDGSGKFSSANLPAMPTSGRSVTAGDYDGDGDLDLFIGGSSRPKHYPTPERSYLLENQNGQFTENTPEFLTRPGIITDAVWNDIDADGDLDLIYTGEWMAVYVAKNNNGTLSETDPLTSTTGWHFHLSIDDFDGNGTQDILIGNIGLNNKFRPNEEYPLHLYYADFDDNGSNDIVLSKDKGSHQLPVRGRECSSQQMPFIVEKFPTFQAFAEADLNEIYGDKLNDAFHVQASDFAHFILFQDKAGSFEKKRLPMDTQRSPLMGVEKISRNGQTYYAYAGNYYPAEVETVRYDAGIGGLMKFNGQDIGVIPNLEHGIHFDRDVRQLESVQLADGRLALVAACNNSPPMVSISTASN